MAFEVTPDLQALLEKIVQDPATKSEVAKAFKKVEPSWQLPADVQIADAKAELKAEIEDLKRQNETARVNAEFDRKRRLIVERYGEENAAAIEKDVMNKYGLNDYEAAAKLWAADQPTPEQERREREPNRQGASWGMPEVDLDAFMQNPKKAARNSAYAFIDQLHGNKR